MPKQTAAAPVVNLDGSRHTAEPSVAASEAAEAPEAEDDGMDLRYLMPNARQRGSILSIKKRSPGNFSIMQQNKVPGLIERLLTDHPRHHWTVTSMGKEIAAILFVDDKIAEKYIEKHTGFTGNFKEDENGRIIRRAASKNGKK